MINVILADHERIFRIGLAGALAAEDDIRIVGQPSTSGQLLRNIESFRPHVVVLSSAFLGEIKAVKRACEPRNTAILLVQDYGAKGWEFASNDIHGMILRSASEGTVVEHIRHLARGGRSLNFVLSPVSPPAEDCVGARVKERLTDRELTIIAYVVQGYKNREIGLHTGTNEHAVKNSLRRIYDKTGMFGRLELALFVMHHRTLLNLPTGTLALATDGALPENFETTKGSFANQLRSNCDVLRALDERQ